MTCKRAGIGVMSALLASALVVAAAQAQAPARQPPAELYGTPVVTTADAPPGASSCSGCHPASASVDTPVPRLIGQKPSDIVAAMQAFRSGQRSGTIMDRIAKGFTDDEIKAIADWYGTQKD